MKKQRKLLTQKEKEDICQRYPKCEGCPLVAPFNLQVDNNTYMKYCLMSIPDLKKKLDKYLCEEVEI